MRGAPTVVVAAFPPSFPVIIGAGVNIDIIKGGAAAVIVGTADVLWGGEAGSDLGDLGVEQADELDEPPDIGGGKTQFGVVCDLVSSRRRRRSFLASSQSANFARTGAGLSKK